MHYVTVGSGPSVVLLHGWPQTWFSWHEVMARLSDQFTLIAPDLRGTGGTERTPTGYDKRTIAEDVRQLIAQVAGGRANVVAHDMGGKAAYVLAKLYPEAVSKLVLVDCMVPGTENINALGGGAWHYGFHMAPEIPEMLSKGHEREYIGAQLRNWSRNKSAITEEAISEYARHYASDGGMTAGFNYYRALREDAPFVATLRDKKFKMPVMTVTGQFGVAGMLAEQLKGEADDLTSHIVEGSGHFVVEEAADFFCKTTREFLTRA
jgi:pimeloyl-ACP methyl ester carboxylesterase